MISPDQIREKCRRLYASAISSWLARETDFFPKRLPVDLTIPTNITEAMEAVDKLRKQSKEKNGAGYRIDWVRRRSRTHGNNDFPVAIYLDSMEDLCWLIGESQSWERLQEAVMAVRGRLPALESWLRQSGQWRRLLEIHAQHQALLAVTEFFLANPRPNVFARQIPVASSKVIEANKRLLAEWLDQLLPSVAIDVRYDFNQFEARYGLKYARPHYLVRPLDDELSKRIEIKFDECSLPAETLAKLPIGNANVYIVENKVNVLTMPRTANSLVLGGLGGGVTQLCEIPWMHDRQITYWGDLDSAGFEILHRLRKVLPNVCSILMDELTLQQCLCFASNVPPREPLVGLNLTSNELIAYRCVCERGIRIEQEHIPEPLIDAELEMSATI